MNRMSVIHNQISIFVKNNDVIVFQNATMGTCRAIIDRCFTDTSFSDYAARRSSRIDDDLLFCWFVGLGIAVLHGPLPSSSVPAS